MSKNEQVTKRLNVEGIDAGLFQRFKICVIQADMTIRKVIIEHLEDYVKKTENALKKMSEKT